jgi:hypothetical protein
VPELTDHDRVVLDEIWDFLLANGRWPNLVELDRRLYQNHDLQGDDVLPQVPIGLLHSMTVPTAERIADPTEIGLTVAGIHATGRGRRELNLFLAVVRHAADVEREYEPPPGQPDGPPSLTSSAVAHYLKLSEATRGDLLSRVGAILRVEPWGWSISGVPGPDWTFQIDRNVRQFRGIPNLDAYLKLSTKRIEAASAGVDTRIRTSAPSPANPGRSTPGRGSPVSLIEVLTGVLTPVGVALAALQLGWGLVRAGSLVLIAITAALAVYRWRVHDWWADPWLAVCIVACALSVTGFVVTIPTPNSSAPTPNSSAGLGTEPWRRGDVTLDDKKNEVNVDPSRTEDPQEDAKAAAADLRYTYDNGRLLLKTPLGHISRVSARTYEACGEVPEVGTESVDVGKLPRDATLCIRTTGKRFAWIKVVSAEPEAVEVSYELPVMAWEK